MMIFIDMQYTLVLRITNIILLQVLILLVKNFKDIQLKIFVLSYCMQELLIF